MATKLEEKWTFTRKAFIDYNKIYDAILQDLLGVPPSRWVNLIAETKKQDLPTAKLLETIFSVLRDEYIEVKVADEANRIAPALGTLLKSPLHLAVLKSNLVIIAQELHIRQDRIDPVKNSI